MKEQIGFQKWGKFSSTQPNYESFRSNSNLSRVQTKYVRLFSDIKSLNPSCIRLRLIFDISDFCHNFLNLSFYKWSKSDHLVSHCEFMFIQVVLLRPHYLCIALINFICTPWLAIWGHKTRKTSEQFEVLIFDSAMGSVRNSFIVIESIWIKINVSID